MNPSESHLEEVTISLSGQDSDDDTSEISPDADFLSPVPVSPPLPTFEDDPVIYVLDMLCSNGFGRENAERHIRALGFDSKLRQDENFDPISGMSTIDRIFRATKQSLLAAALTDATLIKEPLIEAKEAEEGEGAGEDTPPSPQPRRRRRRQRPRGRSFGSQHRQAVNPLPPALTHRPRRLRSCDDLSVLRTERDNVSLVNYVLPTTYDLNPALPIPDDSLLFPNRLFIMDLSVDSLLEIIRFCGFSEILNLSHSRPDLFDPIIGSSFVWERIILGLPSHGIDVVANVKFECPGLLSEDVKSAFVRYVDFEGYLEPKPQNTSSEDSNFVSNMNIVRFGFRAKDHLDEPVNYKKVWSRFVGEKIRLEIRNAAKSELIQEHNQKHQRWEDGINHVVVVSTLLLLGIFLLIDTVLIPLIFENVIPSNALWWLFAYGGIAFIVVPLFLFSYIKNSISTRFYPLYPPSYTLQHQHQQSELLLLVHSNSNNNTYRETTTTMNNNNNGFFDSITLIQTLFLPLVYLILTFGIKVGFFSNEKIWTFINIPCYIFMIYTFICFLIAFIKEFQKEMRGNTNTGNEIIFPLVFVLGVSLGVFSIYGLIMASLILFGLKMDNWVGENVCWSYCIIPLIAACVIFCLQFIVPLCMCFLSEGKGLEEICDEPCESVVLPCCAPSVLSVVVMTPIIAFLVLVALRLDQVIVGPGSWFICFIPFYSVVGLVLGLVGIVVCCGCCAALCLNLCD